MVTYGRGVRSTMAVILALVVGCGSARGGGGPLETPDVPATPDDRGAVVMDSGTPPADVGTPPVDVGAPVDAGSPVDRGVAPMDVLGCVPSGAENTAAACADGLDNDCDGFRDCNDFDCPRATCPRDGGTTSDRPACDSGGSRENTNAECNDGIDNDCDGFTDCVDFSCRTCAITVCVADGGITTRDGGVCLCQGSENTNAACGDRIDNDCDGFIDCGDFDCTMSDGGVSVCASDAGARTDSGAVSDIARD